MNKASVILMTLSLAAVSLAFVPTASAHDCKALSPPTSCGNCLSGTHDHRFSNNTLYCQSSPSDCGGFAFADTALCALLEATGSTVSA